MFEVLIGALSADDQNVGTNAQPNRHNANSNSNSNPSITDTNIKPHRVVDVLDARLARPHVAAAQPQRAHARERLVLLLLMVVVCVCVCVCVCVLCLRCVWFLWFLLLTGNRLVCVCVFCWKSLCCLVGWRLAPRPRIF